MTIADRIAVARALAVVPVIVLVIVGQPTVAAGLFAVAALSDILDGAVARARSETSDRGAFLDQAADKVLVVGTLAALVPSGIVPPWAFAATGVREALVVVLRLTGQAGPSTKAARAKTVLQCVACAVALLALAIPSLAGTAGILITASVALAIATGAGYVVASGRTEAARAR